MGKPKYTQTLVFLSFKSKQAAFHSESPLGNYEKILKKFWHSWRYEMHPLLGDKLTK
jgi:hypothetical protein